MPDNNSPDNISVEVIGDKIHVHGIPDGVRIIALGSPSAKQLEHYIAHRLDLMFAKDCLIRIPKQSDEVIMEALWRSAIIFFHKCFTGGSARSTMLKERKVYKSAGAPEAFQFFSHLRNKHLIHDENSFSSANASAIINAGGKPYKVEKIWTPAGRQITLVQENYDNLALLIDTALEWVDEKYMSLCDEITRDLEAKDLSELLSMPEAQLRAPTVDEVGKRRTG